MDEEQNTGSSEGSKSSEHERGLKETFKSGSPDEVRDKVKSAVQKGVAAVAGALRGFSEEAERNRMPEAARDAVHQAGETTRSTIASVSDEARGLKEPLKVAGQQLRETATDLKDTVRSEVDETKDAFRGERGMGGASGGMGGGEMPDIRDTPMALPDAKLIGKDLSDETED